MFIAVSLSSLTPSLFPSCVCMQVKRVRVFNRQEAVAVQMASEQEANTAVIHLENR